MIQNRSTNYISPNLSIENPISQIIFILCLLITITLFHTPFPTSMAYISISIIYLSVLLHISTSRTELYINKNYMIYFLLLSMIVSVVMVVNASVNVAIRSIILLLSTGINMFILPKIIKLKNFFYVVCRYSVVLVIIGFFPYFGLNIQTNFFDLSLWGAQLYISPELSPITSIFSNPNAFGFLILMGSISALYEYFRYQSNFTLLYAGINIVGLFFTNYRTGMFAFVLSVLLMMVYLIGGQKALYISIITFISTFIIILSIIFNIIPGPTAISGNDLGGRKTTWEYGIQAIRDQSLFGSGIGNSRSILDQYTPPGTGGIHNSFLRVFMTLGVVGGILYTIFYLSTILTSSLNAPKNKMPIIPIFLIVFLITQIFESHSFLGVSLISLPIALIMGYGITDTSLID